MTAGAPTSRGSTCSYCLGGVEPDTAVCPACAAPAHAECWAENGGCPVLGCQAAPLTAAAAAPPAAAPPFFADWSSSDWSGSTTARYP